MRRRGCLAAVLAASALFLAPAALAAPADELEQVLADYDAYVLEQNPYRAAERGDLEAARRWSDVSPEAEAARTAALEDFAARLEAVETEGLGADAALNHELLSWRIGTDLAEQRFDTGRAPFNAGGGFFSATTYVGGRTRLKSRDEAEAYLDKLAALPAYYDQHVENMRRGLEDGFVKPKLVAEASARAVRAQADRPAEEHPLLQAFDSLPSAMPEKEKARFRKRGLDVVKTRVKPAERDLAEFFEDEYVPNARESLGASELPNGRAFYEHRVRRFTTTDMTPDEVFEVGEAEVARIRAAMDAIIAEVGFEGDFDEFLEFLRTDPQFYVDTREELLEKASRIAKRIDDRMPEYFRTLPRLSYGVRPVPREIEEGYTSGRYFPGSPERGVAGGLMINTSKLDQRPLYALPSLAAHEGAPGHHTQIALAQEQEGVPEFRRSDGVGAFVEGWALYTEQLAGEMGIYETPYQWFGQLSMEMWRACRLVVDVGLHWKGWTRDQAVACFTENSALSDANIQSEVDRYIANPGQALGYKIGELKISELRARAEDRLGEDFDIREFHDVVLLDGPMPLNVLERRVDDWIAQEAAG